MSQGEVSGYDAGTAVEHLNGMGKAEPVCYRLPPVRLGDIVPTVKTVKSTYCRCRACGWPWHEERTEPPPDTGPKRRRNDTT